MRQCIHEGKAGCATCAKGPEPKDNEDGYCYGCGVNTDCGAYDSPNQIPYNAKCSRCRWVLPADRR